MIVSGKFTTAFKPLACAPLPRRRRGWKPSVTARARISAFVQFNNSLHLTQEAALCSRSVREKSGALVRNAFGGLLLGCVLLGGLDEMCVASAATFGRNFSSGLQEAPAKGDCATCLGVVDDTLGTCGAARNCVSTFDDRPDFFVAPWEFPGKLRTAFEELRKVLMKEGGQIVEERDRYMHVLFVDRDNTIDDLEVLFSIPSEDATLNIRSASRRLSQGDNGRNHKRLERIRRALMWEEVPVLRNRSRKLFFLESPWDTFGPEPPPTFDYSEKLEFVPE